MPKLLRKQELRDDPNDPITSARNISKLSLQQGERQTEEKMALDSEAGTPFPLTFRVPEGSRLQVQDLTNNVADYNRKCYVIESLLDKLTFLTNDLFLVSKLKKTSKVADINNLLEQITKEKEELDDLLAEQEQYLYVDEEEGGLTAEERQKLNEISEDIELYDESIKEKEKLFIEMGKSQTTEGDIIQNIKTTTPELINTFSNINIGLLDLTSYFLSNFKKIFNTANINDTDKYEIIKQTEDLLYKISQTFSSSNVVSLTGKSVFQTLLELDKNTYAKLYEQMIKNIDKLENQIKSSNKSFNTQESFAYSMLKGGAIPRSRILPYTFIEHPQHRDPHFRNNPRRYEL
jgi:hypothetical protein